MVATFITQSEKEAVTLKLPRKFIDRRGGKVKGRSVSAD